MIQLNDFAMKHAYQVNTIFSVINKSHFQCTLQVGELFTRPHTGSSKKAAKMHAAQEMMSLLRNDFTFNEPVFVTRIDPYLAWANVYQTVKMQMGTSTRMLAVTTLTI